MNSFFKPFLFTGAALLLAAAPSLRAQSADDLQFSDATRSDIVSVQSGGTLLLSAGTIPLTTPLTIGSFTFPRIVRKYTGTVTQTTAAGVTTTGTFTLNVESDGSLAGIFTIGGVNSDYDGAVARTKLGERRVNGSGYLQPLTVIRLTTNADGTPAQIVSSAHDAKTGKIPLVINSTSITGGSLNADGSSLLFRGDRVAKSQGN